MNDYVDLIGQPVRRVEDCRLLTGKGRFTDDLYFSGQLHARFVRSPHAHAYIKSIDGSVALRMPGVRAYADGETLAKVGIQPIDSLARNATFPLTNKDGSPLPDVRRWPLARGKVRFAGEPVAVVVADTVVQAMDAAEAVAVDYEPLEPVVDIGKALSPNTTKVWEELDSNLCVDSEAGDRQRVEHEFASAFKVISKTVNFPRHAVVFMEPRAVIARYCSEDDRFEVYCGSQSIHWYQQGIAGMLNVPVQQVRIICPDTGGGFGARTSPYPEYAVVAWLAKHTGRTVRTTLDRSESFLTDSQSRDHSLRIDLAIDMSGFMKAIRLSSRWRLGAYLNPRMAWLHASYMHLVICGVYRIPAAYFQLQGVFSNTATIGAFRGVARTEVAYALERVVGKAAREMGMGVVCFRELNMIKPNEMPWNSPSGAHYSAGDYTGNLELLNQQIDWIGYKKRYSDSEKAGKLRGIGLSVYLDSVGGAPNEFAQVVVKHDIVEACVGTKSTGVAHETVFAQLLASLLKISMRNVSIVDGDTDRVRTGSGTHASRSLRIGGSAIYFGAKKILKITRHKASEFLEVDESDLEYELGAFVVSGTDRKLGLFEIAEKMRQQDQPLTAEHEHVTEGALYASGCQFCELEVDPETGEVCIERLLSVCDPGKIFNPLVAEGQIHGGVAQGIGHSLYEQVHYDETTGQLFCGSLLDYTLPRADNLPSFETLWNPIETAENPLGTKGVGEPGITGCPAAVMNAIDDALRLTNSDVLQMPATPQRLWSILRSDKTR